VEAFESDRTDNASSGTATAAGTVGS